MRKILSFSTIEETEADDLFIVCASFEEERCRETTRRALNYSAKCSVIINPQSGSGRLGAKKQERSAEFLIERLREFDLRKIPRLLSVAPYNYFSLWNMLSEELDRRGLAWGELRATIDISCLTKIQMIFLLKEIISTTATRHCRLLYTVPERYNRERGDKFSWLSVGYFDPVPFPIRAEPRIARNWRRATMVLLGHEGQRTLAAWRYVDPDETILVFGKSDNDAMIEACLRENEFLLSHVGGENSDQTICCGMTDTLVARNRIYDWLRNVSAKQDVTVSLIPFGPKPILLGALLAILDMPWIDVELVYPIPSSYNHNYSIGAKEIYTLDLP